MISLLRGHGALSGSETNLDEIFKVLSGLFSRIFAVPIQADAICAIVQIQKENQEQREKQRRASMTEKEVSESVEAKGCEKLETSLIPCVRHALDEIENRAISLHICMEEFTPALRSSLTNMGILERAAIKFMGAKYKITMMVRTAAACLMQSHILTTKIILIQVL